MSYDSGSQTVSHGSLGSCGILPGEPQTIKILHNFICFLIILFKFADVDILHSIGLLRSQHTYL